MNWLKRLFKRDKYEDFALEPAYEPGDLVVVYSPYVLDGMDAHEVREPRFETVKQSAYIYNLGIFVYQFDGGIEWYNESWLFPAVYGTETITVEFPKVPSNREKVDALLDDYNDYKRLADEFGDGAYADRLRVIETELREFVEK